MDLGDYLCNTGFVLEIIYFRVGMLRMFKSFRSFIKHNHLRYSCFKLRTRKTETGGYNIKVDTKL